MTPYTPPSVPDLVARLGHPDGRAGPRAAEELARRKPPPREAVPALAAAATDDDRYVRLWAARALAAIGRPTPTPGPPSCGPSTTPTGRSARRPRALADAIDELEGDDLAALAEATARDVRGVYDRLTPCSGGPTRTSGCSSGPGGPARQPGGYLRSRAAEELADIGWPPGTPGASPSASSCGWSGRTPTRSPGSTPRRPCTNSFRTRTRWSGR